MIVQIDGAAVSISERVGTMLRILLERQDWIDETPDGELHIRFNSSRKIGIRRISDDGRCREA